MLLAIRYKKLENNLDSSVVSSACMRLRQLRHGITLQNVFASFAVLYRVTSALAASSRARSLRNVCSATTLERWLADKHFPAGQIVRAFGKRLRGGEAPLRLASPTSMRLHPRHISCLRLRLTVALEFVAQPHMAVARRCGRSFLEEAFKCGSLSASALVRLSCRREFKPY
ncbi:hypothetical protein MRX96_023647 [Rhipicephalus microplus]